MGIGGINRNNFPAKLQKALLLDLAQSLLSLFSNHEGSGNKLAQRLKEKKDRRIQEEFASR
jgi:hypothetical protein